MTAKVERVDSWGWKGLSLGAGRVSLVVVPGAGGRIVSLKLDGVEALFSMRELRGRRIDLSRTVDVRRKKRELGWLHYGGGVQDLACAAGKLDRWSPVP